MLLTRFVRDRRAAVAPAVAGAILPLVIIIGAAVDYGRAAAARTALQGAVDAAALALSKEAPGLSAAELTARATAYVAAVFTRNDATPGTITAQYTATNGSRLVITGTAAVKPLFMNFVPFAANGLTISASSTAVWGQNRLRVALVLDNTGSMADAGKMTALKTATHNLLDQLKKAATNDGDVYVSIIPFNRDVNVGASNDAQSWIDWTDWDAENGTCSKTKYHSQSTCTANGGTWTPKVHTTWNGCVMDRDQNYDTLNTAPTAGSTLFPAHQYSACPVSLLPLTYDWAALKSKVDAMTPAGTTNQTIGLAWGWQSLTQGAPLDAPAEDPNYKYQKIIILLTDGLNTQNRWSSSQSAIDARTQKACDNIKADGITIYTVQVNTNGDPTSTLLQNCASDSGKFFLLTSANEIITTFDTIGTNLTKLRIAM